MIHGGAPHDAVITKGLPPIAYIGLGSNVGPSRDAMALAVRRLAALGRVAGVSSLWRTAPRDRTDQPPFLNAVAAIDGTRRTDPEALLAELKSIERAIGRVDRDRFGPREIDLDVLLFSQMSAVVRLPAIEVPHPRLRERRFALEPLAELAPDERDPASGRTVRELLDGVRDQEAEKVAGPEWWMGA
jgi:2-amino-4-hydroxy-6-hydroxymethyldihydropteridine diphosphokinase